MSLASKRESPPENPGPARLAFGGASLSAATAREAETLIGAALDEDITLFDSAQCYGRSEEHLGRLLAPHRDRVRIVTKCGHHEVLPDGRWRSFDISTADIDSALRRLRTDHLDAMLLHSYDPDRDRLTRALDVLRSARDSGKIRALGYSGDNDGARLALELAPDLDVLELSLSVADQANLDVLLPAARARGIAVLAKRALANAAWRHLGRPETAWGSAHEAPYVRRLATMGCVAAAAPDGLPWDESALRFVLHSPGLHAAIVGASRTENLRRNAALARRISAPPVDDAAHAAWRDRFAAASAVSATPWPALN